MPTRHATTVVIAFLCGLAASALTSPALGADPAPSLPGVTSPDETPDGCVSCHKGENSLKKMLAALDHRSIEGKVEVVPDDCKDCHDKEEDLDPMAQVAHSMHYASGSRSEFVTRHGGSCLACHSLAMGTGEVSIKRGNRNW